MTYYNSKAKEVLDYILEHENNGNYNVNYPMYLGDNGLFVDNNKVVAFDNNDGHCWVEEFDNEKDALQWLNK